MSTSNPEIGRSILVNGANVNYHDYGQGAPLFLIHGSGPGVSAWANWRLVLPKFGETRRAIAPDMFGFGFTDRPQGMTYNLDVWVDQVIALMDALKIEKTDLVGNSFGGAIALAVAIRHPDRVRRLILMGSVGVHFPLTKGLDAAWGYTPSIENMRALLDVFAFDRTLVTMNWPSCGMRPAFVRASKNPSRPCSRLRVRMGSKLCPAKKRTSKH